MATPAHSEGRRRSTARKPEAVDRAVEDGSSVARLPIADRDDPGRGETEQETPQADAALQPVNGSGNGAVLEDALRAAADWVWATDRDGRLLHVTEPASRSLGIPSALAIGRDFGAVLGANVARGDTSARRLVELLGRGRAFRDLEITLATADGHRRMLSVSGVPVFDPESERFLGFRGTAVDVTDRRLPDLSMDRLRATVAQSPVAVLVADAAGNIDYVNPMFTAALGYTLDELAARPLPVQLCDERRALAERLAEVGRTGVSWEGEAQLDRRDGAGRWFVIHVAPMRDREGRITHVVAVFEDVDDRKQLEQQLTIARRQAEAANQAKSVFLAMMSHELRTPLNAIIGFSEFIQEGKLVENDPEKVVGYARDISESGHHLLSLVDEILDISRIEAGVMTLTPKRIDPTEVARRVVRLLTPMSDRVGATLVLEAPGVAPIMVADRRALQQILFNLVGNAIKFTPAGGRVVVTLRAEDEEVEFQVSDSGVGIPLEDLERVWHAFERVEPSRRSNADGGAGLGLSIVRGLTQLHGGRAWIDSTIGKGTTVTVRLPMTAKPAEDQVTMIDAAKFA